MKRVVELLGQHGGSVGDWMEIDDHLASVSLLNLQNFYEQKVDPATPDPFDRSKGDDYQQKDQVELLRKLAFEAWCRRDPFDFINRHPDPIFSQDQLPIRQATIKDPHRTMRFMEGSRGNSGYDSHEFFQALAEYYPDLALQAARGWSEQDLEGVAGICTREIHDSAQRWEWAEMVHYRMKEKGEEAVRDILGLIARDDPEFLKGRAGQGVLAAYPDAVTADAAPGETTPPPRDPSIGEALPALKDGALPENPNPGPHEGRIHYPRREWERWFSRDPVAAMAWLDSIRKPHQRENMLCAVVETAARTDLQSLDQLLARLTNPDERKLAIGTAVVFLENQESFAALRRFVNRYTGAREEVSDPKILNP